MIRILFVCFGNICRSPMAEFIFKDLAERRFLGDFFEVASAATSAENKGMGIYPPARRKLEEHDIFPDGKRARQMQRRDYENYDYLIGMETSNLKAMRRIAGGDPQHKISRLLNYTNDPRNIADPWYTDDFETAYRDILEGCSAFLACLMRENHLS